MEAEDPYAGLTKKEIKRLKKKQKKKGSLMILFQDLMRSYLFNDLQSKNTKLTSRNFIL